MAMEMWLAVVHVGATFAMTGLIWFVQIVHYPLFAVVAADSFVAYAERHVRQTSWVVAPLMLLEVVTSIGLLWCASDTLVAALAWLGSGLLVTIWLSTALQQVPCHRRLVAGHDPVVIRRLVRTNWIRTIAWTVRALVAVAIAMHLWV